MTNTTIDGERARELLRQMQTIRAFETRVETLFKAGELPGFVHSCAGQEAIAVGVCSQLTRADYITSTHRGHGHAIAKGIALDAIFAELYGKEAGACRGRGGSMHVADFSIGMLGANGIVGGGFGIATGAALAIKYQQRQRGRRVLLRRRRREQGHVPRGVELRRGARPARRVRVREQPVRPVHGGVENDRGDRHLGAGRVVRDRRREHRRQRPVRRDRLGRPCDRTGAHRWRRHAHQHGDVPPQWALRRRRGAVPRARGGRCEP